MLTTPERRIAEEFAPKVLVALDEALARAEKAEAERDKLKVELHDQREGIRLVQDSCEAGMTRMQTALRAVRDILAQIWCDRDRSLELDRTKRLCDGDGCYRCAAIREIDQALGEECPTCQGAGGVNCSDPFHLRPKALGEEKI